MKIIHQTIGAAIACLVLSLTPGCQTAPGAGGSTNNTAIGSVAGGILGAVAGALIAGPNNRDQGAAIGALLGAAAGGAIGHHMDEAQRQWLKEHAPQTLETIDHNDAVAEAAAKGTPQAALAPKEPLTVAQIKDVTVAGVKNDVVIDEIQKSGTKYSPQDIAELQQAGVSSDVINFIKTQAAS